MAQPAAKSRSPARAELDACQVLTDRFQAQLAVVSGQGISLGVVADRDVESLAFTVMMEAARSSREDLRAVMADINVLGASKAGLRRRLEPGAPSRKLPDTALDAEAVVQLMATIAVADIVDEVRDLLRIQRDSLSEMGELESLRLQMALDRVSKMMSTLSNLMKALADTQSAIVQNLK